MEKKRNQLARNGQTSSDFKPNNNNNKGEQSSNNFSILRNILL